MVKENVSMENVLVIQDFQDKTVHLVRIYKKDFIYKF